MLESKVYVGVSAGSMIFSGNLSERTGEAFGEQEDLRILGDTPARSPFGLFDWYLKPHLNSPGFPIGPQDGLKKPPLSSISPSTPSMTTRLSAFAVVGSTLFPTASGGC